MSRGAATRLGRALLCAIPIGVFVWLYWFGLRAWFQQDDFAWLALRSEVHSLQDFLRALFQPRAQGTIRPWSERLFFLALFDRYGLDHRPFHIVVALTQCANLLLLQSIVRRITASRLAAVVSACVWLAGAGLATPLSWLSTYNQILCAFFLLLAFRLLLRYIDTGQSRWWWAQVVVFVLGFGALEVNVVYPALAAAWCWLAARQHLRRALWLPAGSAAYALAHFHFAPKPSEGVYARHWDLSIVPTYFSYWRAALAAEPIGSRADWPLWAWNGAAILLGASGLAFLVWAWRRGDRLAAFGLLWFTVALAPLLPLRDHFSLYYLAVPSLGLALIAASAVALSRRAGWGAFGVCAAFIAFHLYLAVPFNRATTAWHFERGLRIRSLVEGLERAHELHPGQMIALAGIDSELFWAGYFDRPYSLYGLTETCLVPGSDRSIDAHPELGDIAPYLCSTSVLADTARQHRLTVYAYDGPYLRNITRKFIRQNAARWNNTWPDFVDVGLPSYARYLGAGWYEIQGTFRWMGPRAEITMAAPASPGGSLSVSGYCPAEHLSTPIHLTVSAEGMVVGRQVVTRQNNSFTLAFPLPDALAGKPNMKLTLSVDRTVTPPDDGRALGLVFGKLALRAPAGPAAAAPR
jgi:hypothetical protein